MASTLDSVKALIDGHAVTQAHSGPIAYPAGGDSPRVMFVGLRPWVPENIHKPFNSMGQSLLRAMLRDMGLPDRLFWFSYLIKRGFTSYSDMRVDDGWRSLLLDEVRMVRPGAVVLLGPPVARAVLGLWPDCIPLSFADAFKVRYEIKSVPGVPIFASYAPEQVWSLMESTPAVVSFWVSHLDAVFNADASFFTGIQEIADGSGS